MKNFTLVLCLLLLGVILVMTGLAANKKPAQESDNLRKSIDKGTLSMWQAKLGTTFLKNLAYDDVPQAQFVNFQKFMDESYKVVNSIPSTFSKSLKAREVSAFGPPLSGTYHIGVAKDYATLSDAATALNSNGVSGPVTMVFDDASYPTSAPVVLGTVTGASATNKITFTAKAGVNAVVNFEIFPALNYGLVLANTHYVTFDGTSLGGTLSFGVDEVASTFPSANPYAGTIAIANFSDNLAIKNMTITGYANAPLWDDVSDARNGIVLLNTVIGTSQISEVTISGNNFGRCFYGVLSTVPNAGNAATAADAAFGSATVYHLKVLNNKFGKNATGLQPCAMAVSVGGYTAGPGYFAGGAGVEIAGNLSDGDQYNNNFNFAPSTTVLEQVVRAGLSGPIDIWLSGDKASTVHNNRVDRWLYHKSLTHINFGVPDFSYAISIRSGSYIGGPSLGYNNLITRMTSDETGSNRAFCFGTRTEGADWTHNTSVANGTGGRNIAGRVRSGGKYNNNIFLASSSGGSPRSVALRYEGGTGRGNVIAATPSTSSTRRLFYSLIGPNGGGAPDYNNLALHIGLEKSDSSSSDQDPALLSDADLHVNPAAASGASSIGVNDTGFVHSDYDGIVRSLTTPDAGAYEVTGIDPTNVDVGTQAILAPPAAGTPIAVPVVPKASVENISNSSQVIPVTMTIADGSGYTSAQSITLLAHSAGTVSFTTWTPPGNGPYTITVKTSLGGDVIGIDDSVTRSQAIVPLLSTFPQNFDFGTGVTGAGPTPQGWVGTGSWRLDDEFDDCTVCAGNILNLGGPHGGTGAAWVTDDGTTGSSYAVQTNHQLLSPFFNTTGFPTLYVNFFHSIRTEPRWDRSVFEYSLDTGKTWVPIGDLNDTNGINWYSTNPYANADTSIPSCFDGATARTVQWPDARGANYPAWSSSGDCGGLEALTGPFGWIFSQIKIPAAACNKPFVRFRYAAFSDGATADAGWAVDDVQFSTTPNNTKGQLKGMVYGDGNANGTEDGYESGLAGKKVRLTGAKTDSTTTDGGGNYSFGNLISGAYTVSLDHAAGTSVTQPYGPNTYSALFGPGDTLAGKDFGLFTGGISGDPYKDDNENGKKDAGEGGAKGWEVRAYPQADLAAFKHALATGDQATLDAMKVASALTDAGGNYFIEAKTGDYIIAEVLDPQWENTQPGVVDTARVDDGHGSLMKVDLTGYYSAVHIDSTNPGGAGGRFGNFKFGRIKVFLTIDVNGNGVKDLPSDASFPMPFGTSSSFTLYKNTVATSSYSIVGSGSTDYFWIEGLGVGNYRIQQSAVTPGWVQTLGGTHVTNVFASGVSDTASYLNFQTFCISGTKFNDLNGNGTLDGGEPGLAGWVIKVKGADTATAVTDANGFYQFCGLFKPGKDTVYEVSQAGYLQTKPAAGAPYVFTVANGTNKPNTNFGNFKTVSISGQAYRDRNGNGAKDAGDNGLSGWAINGTNGLGGMVSDVSGNYSFTNVGPGTYVLSEVTQPPTYNQTAPGGGTYSVTAVSGTNVTGRDFGNFQQSDSAKYRTWTYSDLKQAGEAKAAKRPKAGKPILGPPNSANMLVDLLGAPKLAVLQVGLAGQLVGGKEKGYIMPGKQGDVFATFNAKGVMHTAAAKPLSFFNDGIKRILKRVKSLPATKADNTLAADLLTFKINLAASAKGQTDPGLALGNLIYCAAGHAGLTGKTLAAIGAYADSLVTNWDDRGLPGTPSAMWTDLDNVVASVNAAFSTGLTTDTLIPTGGWTFPKLKWALSANTAAATGFLCAPGPGIENASNPGIPTNSNPPAIPAQYGLSNNYPNPFNPTTTMSIDLPFSSVVTLKVYNMLGQDVATLYNNEQLDAGTWDVDFDASAFTSGVYFYRVTAQAINDDGMATGNTFTMTKKMMLVK